MKIILFLLSVLCLIGCKKTAPRASVSAENSIPINFSPDSAYAYIQAQVDFGARIPTSQAHKNCGDYLVAQLTRFGAHVSEQKASVTIYDGSILPLRNIIGSYRPAASKRVLLCAHWDCRPWADQDSNPANHTLPVLGANDGASGVGVLLEVARQLSKSAPNIGIDIIFFDMEDHGAPEFYTGASKDNMWCLGSQFWAKKLYKSDYKAAYGILLDMVGAPDATFPREYFSEKYAPQVLNQVWQTAQSCGFGQWFVNEQVYPITDDHYFVSTLAGIPCIDIIHFNQHGNSNGFADYWHTTNDNMQNISKSTLNAVGITLMTIIRNEQ